MCIFCQIVSGEIPSYKVYEDEKTLAFLDIRPVNPGHTLVIPKAHYKNLEEIPEAELSETVVVVKKIGRLLKEKLDVAGYNVFENNDPVAGQEVSHLHFHIVPRRLGDGHAAWQQQEYQPGIAAEVLKKLTS